MTRKPTATSAFGVSRRESHDASGFYGRFTAPHLSSDDTVLEPLPIDDPCRLGDARAMDDLADGSVALVVTSPPYFAGKTYEAELGHGGVPASYLEYLELLEAVFRRCVDKLEPGGRLAINVANLGRKPFRNLAADLTTILQDDLGLLLRGEVVWQKAKGASGSCAWGSFRSPANPVLRDTTERVIVASKGRFDRALSAPERARRGLPAQSTISADEFMAATLDVWTIDAESATRVGHPAPFPVELPRRLIELLSYHGDLVLDPFMGSGTTLVAAAQAGRRAVGYDLDPAYVDLARSRVAGVVPIEEAVATKTFKEEAKDLLTSRGFTIEAEAVRPRGLPLTVDLVAVDQTSSRWHVLIVGSRTVTRPALSSSTVVLETLGRAQLLRAAGAERVLVLCPELPGPKTEAAQLLRAGAQVVLDCCGTDPESLNRLERHGAGASHQPEPRPPLEDRDGHRD